MCFQEYDKLKASDPDFYRAADSMSYGGAGKVPEANIDKMVAELNERYDNTSLRQTSVPLLVSCCISLTQIALSAVLHHHIAHL